MVSSCILPLWLTSFLSRQELTEELSAPIGLKPVGDAQFLDQLNQIQFFFIHSLKLTAKAPENRPKPKREPSYSNHPFSGAMSC